MKMSGLNGSGEMSLGNLKVEIAESNVATLFAQDIVNEVLQKALTIASQVHESKLTWNSVGGDKDSRNLIGKYVKETCDVNLEETQKICENLHLSEMETEKAVTDVASLPCKDLPGRGGVGDQPILPIRNSEIEVSDQPAPQECTATPVEKKSRVADLVKSSKQLLSAYIMDEKAKRIRDKLEEEQEQFLQVIELDSTDSSKAEFKAHKKYEPETVPLPNDDILETEEELLQISACDTMDTIDLNASTTEQSEDVQEKSEMESAKEHQNLDGIAKSERENLQSTSSEANTGDQKDKKKRWNLGARFMQFLRRPKQKARGTQTVSRK